MAQTPNLNLPYLLAAQSQKHVTHNEAIRALDALVQIAVIDRNLATPPEAPADGDRYLVPASPGGAWSGEAGTIAAWQDNAWLFYAPQPGWTIWVQSDAMSLVWDGSNWQAPSAVANVNPAPLVGVNATADTTNRLSVSGPATLLTHDGNGHQLKVNKATAADTASLLFQTNYSGRAEIGLAGNDNLSVKVSADGSTWADALLIDGATGAVSLPNSTLSSGGGAGNEIWINVSDAPYSAAGDGVTDDLAAIQAALDAANTAGGGTVWLPANTYYVSNTLQLYNNVELRGAGNGTSTIKGPVGAYAGKTISGVSVYGSIALTGVVGAAVRNLTVDHQTNGTTANGVVIGSAGAAVRSSRCVIENVRVLGDDSHQYLIWAQNADFNTIRGCHVEAGGTIPTTDTAGIEIYGGVGNLVEGCWAYHCNPGIALVQETAVAGCDLIDTRVIANRIDACGNGIVATNTNGRQLVNTLIARNIISNCTNRGLNLGTSATGSLRNLVFADNVMDANTTHVAIDSNGSTVTGSKSMIVAGNVISGGALGIGVYWTPGVTVKANTVVATSGVSISVNHADRVEVRDNRIRAPGAAAIEVYTTLDGIVYGNTALELPQAFWQNADTGSSNWDMRRNYVERAAGNSSNVVAGSVTTNITWRDNKVVNPPTVIADLGAGGDTDATVNYPVPGTALDNISLAGDFVRFNATPAGCELHGIVGGYDGRTIRVYNNNGTNSLALKANNSGSLAANRLSLGAAGSVTVGLYQTATLRYSGIDKRWMFVSLV